MSTRISKQLTKPEVDQTAKDVIIVPHLDHNLLIDLKGKPPHTTNSIRGPINTNWGEKEDPNWYLQYNTEKIFCQPEASPRVYHLDVQWHDGWVNLTDRKAHRVCDIIAIGERGCQPLKG